MRAKYVHIETASARDVLDRWLGNYPDGKCTPDKQAITERLRLLGSQPSIDDVAEAIGNKSWSYLACDGCSEYIKIGVRIGDEYSDKERIYCAICIAEAAEILKTIGEPK